MPDPTKIEEKKFEVPEPKFKVQQPKIEEPKEDDGFQVNETRH